MAETKDIAMQDTPYFQHTPTGLMIHGLPSFKECCDHLNTLKMINVVSQFWIGDLLNYMEVSYGETYTQAVTAFDYSVQTLANMKSVARAFPPSRRREGIPFSHHAAIQGLPNEQQNELLDEIEKEHLNIQHLRNKVRQLKGTNKNPEPCSHEAVMTCMHCGKVME